MDDGCATSQVLEDLLSNQITQEQREALVSHLGDCPRCSQLVSELLVTTRPPGQSGRKRTAIHPGQVLGRYVIVEPLGSGGMGTVYRANDPLLGRQVAIKVLHELVVGMGVPILEEGRALAKLAHPNVVPVYEGGTDGEQSFLVMQLIEGITLREWLEVERPWKEVVTRFLAAARGLAATHEAGLIHGDFKPGNVLIDLKGNVQVVDYGLGQSWVDAELEGWRAGAGTPGYMAPEVRLGRRPDPRSDQYSFFVALFEALAGVRPFEGETSRTVVSALAAGVPPALPRGPKLPRWLKSMIQRGLGPQEERFASMQDVVTRLEAGLAKRVVPLWAVAVGGLSAVAALTVWAFSSLGLVCVDQGAMASVWNPSVARRVESAFTATGLAFGPASFQTVKAQIEHYAAGWERMNQRVCERDRFLRKSADAPTLRRACLSNSKDALMAWVDSLSHLNRETLAMAAYGSAGLPGIEACDAVEDHGGNVTLPPEPQLEQVKTALRLAANANVLHASQQFSQAQAVATESLSLSVDAGYAPAVAEAQYQVGAAVLAQGNVDEGLSHLKEAAWLAERYSDWELVARAAIEIVRAQRLTAHADEAETWSRLGQAMIERLHQPALLRGHLENAISAVKFGLNQYPEAISHSRAAIVSLTESLGPHAAGTLNARVRLADALRRHGDYSASLNEAQQVINLAQASWGDDHPLTAAAIRVLASGEYRLARYADSAAHYRRVAEIFGRVYGLDSTQRMAELMNLSGSALEMGRLTEASEAIEESMRIAALFPDRNVRVILSGQLDRAEVMMAQGRYAEAQAVVEDVAQKQRAAGFPDFSETFLALGKAELGLHQYVPALAHFRESLGQYEAEYGLEHPHVVWALNAIGQSLQLLNRWDESVEPLERALNIGAKSESHPDRLAFTKWLLAGALAKTDEQRERALRLANESEPVLRAFPRLKKELPVARQRD